MSKMIGEKSLYLLQSRWGCTYSLYIKIKTIT